jgi:large subunit ribosomal protein L1
MSKTSKAYREAAEKVDRDNLYTPLEAAKLAKETSSKKQDATVEVAIRLGVDPRKADQMVRGTVNLPHGTGKTARVIVFAVGEKAEAALAAGADEVGSDDLIEKIQGGFLDFDAAIATPDQMAKVGKIARVLGPRGLMPNPKTGTVTPDVAKAVNEIKGGKINFRVDKQANLHFVIGKASFDEKSLAENYGAAIDEIMRAKPSSSKGRYLKKVVVSTTKYDATVEVAIRLGVDPRKADQMVRGTVNLPHGTGKTARVIVFAVGEKAEAALAAGADEVGSDDLIEKIQGGFLDFDAAIATPDQMAKVGKIARVLGPRGLMPNPKTGTVTPDVAKAVNEIKGGKINFRVDKQANLHFVIGKASFDETKLAENYGAAIDEIMRAKPSSSKGRYLKKIVVSTTTGPGIQVDPQITRNFAEA